MDRLPSCAWCGEPLGIIGAIISHLQSDRGDRFTLGWHTNNYDQTEKACLDLDPAHEAVLADPIDQTAAVASLKVIEARGQGRVLTRLHKPLKRLRIKRGR